MRIDHQNLSNNDQNILSGILLITYHVRKYCDGGIIFVTHSLSVFVWFWADQSILGSILYKKMNIVSTSTLNLHISCFTWITFLQILSLTRFQFSVFLPLWIIFMIDFRFLLHARTFFSTQNFPGCE